MNLNKDEHAKLIKWIETNFYPIETTNYTINSYGIQWLFEISDGGFYVDNDCIKSAMMECGFIPGGKKMSTGILTFPRIPPGC